jgi:hypothetical protein
VNLPVTTRSGRQVKLSKQAQAAALAEIEKKTTARQRKKEQAKKDQNATIPRQETYKAVSQVTQKNATTPNPSVASIVCTPSASVYHTPLRGIHRISRKVKANAIVFTGARCPTCSRVMPPRKPVTPTNTHSASQSAANSKISNKLNSVPDRANSGPTVSSNLRLASVTARHHLSAVPSPLRASSAPDTAGHANTTATLLEAMTGTQDSAQAQVPVRGGRSYLRARGARGNIGDGRGRGWGGSASAPLTTVMPARPRPVAPASPAVPPASASTAVIAPTNAGRHNSSRRSAGGSGTTSTHTANPVPATAASSEARVPPKIVRPGSVNTTSGADHKVTVAAFAHAYYSRYNTSQIATAGSNANTGVGNTANSHIYTSGPSGTSIFGAIGPTSTRAYYPRYYPSPAATAANTTANAATGPSHDRAIDFSDPEFWIMRTRSTGNLPGFAAQEPNNVARSAVAASSNRVHTTVASSSQVDTRQTKKRKLNDGI